MKIFNMVTESLKRKWIRLRCAYLRMSAGINTPFEFVLAMIGETLGLVGFSNIRQKLSASALARRRKKMFLAQDCYIFKEAKIPLLGPHEELNLLTGILEEIFYSYLYMEDNYDVNDVSFLNELMPDGFYIYSDRTCGIDLNLRPDDVVIDAGAWIGDFAAYASVCGAITYAFEPIPKTFEILGKTSRLNKNIIPVNMALGAKKEELGMVVKEHGTPNAYISSSDRGRMMKVQVTTLDDFVEENKLERVDFIKADIEGYERFMLQGARNVLKKFGPRLAICTYHLPDDPQVLESIIKEINPAYKVIQRKMKLFAYT